MGVCEVGVYVSDQVCVSGFEDLIDAEEESAGWDARGEKEKGEDRSGWDDRTYLRCYGLDNLPHGVKFARVEEDYAQGGDGFPHCW